MKHEIKIGVNFADAIVRGEKTFELRRNDRGYQKADRLVFFVIDRDGEPLEVHPLHGEEYLITYVLSGWGLRDGFCALSIIGPVEPEDETLPF